jgi:fluoride exporter
VIGGQVAAVAAGGALGAAARWAIGVAWPSHPAGFPWATFATNVAGCAALGMLVALLDELTDPHRLLRPFLGTGVLGGFTTFSAYAMQARDLAAEGRVGTAAAYVAGTLVAALSAVWLGIVTGRLVARGRYR